MDGFVLTENIKKPIDAEWMTEKDKKDIQEAADKMSKELEELEKFKQEMEKQLEEYKRTKGVTVDMEIIVV